MINLTKPKITILGAGIIGSALAKNIYNGGFNCSIWNRSVEKLYPLQQFGLKIFTNIAEAVSGADIIITILKDADAVLDAMSKAKPYIKNGAIWLQMSTVGVAGIDTLAKFAQDNDLVFFDIPVQGTKAPAEQGQLILLASGPQKQRPFLEPIFKNIAQKVLWIDENPSASSRLKLCLNSYVLALTHAIGESFKLANVLNVDPQNIVDIISGGPLDNGYFQAKSTAILNNDFEINFTVANGLKDGELIVDAASQAGVSLDIAKAGNQRFERAIAEGHGEEDIAATYFA